MRAPGGPSSPPPQIAAPARGRGTKLGSAPHLVDQLRLDTVMSRDLRGPATAPVTWLEPASARQWTRLGLGTRGQVRRDWLIFRRSPFTSAARGCHAEPGQPTETAPLRGQGESGWPLNKQGPSRCHRPIPRGRRPPRDCWHSATATSSGGAEALAPALCPEARCQLGQETWNGLAPGPPR